MIRFNFRNYYGVIGVHPTDRLETLEHRKTGKSFCCQKYTKRFHQRSKHFREGILAKDACNTMTEKV